MVRRGAWFLMLILAALVGLMFLMSSRQEAAEAAATPTAGVRRVFGPENGNVVSIRIETASGEGVDIAKNSTQEWEVRQPVAGAANQGLAEAAATQVGSLRVLAAVEGAPEIFGLEEPVYLVRVQFDIAGEHTLEIGSKTPTSSGYYARLDGEAILVVGLTGVDALLELLAAPPYLETPTPSPQPPTATLAAPSATLPASVQSP